MTNFFKKYSKYSKNRGFLAVYTFKETVESVLLYGSESWTLTVADEKALDGMYTRMLRVALDVSWEEHMRNVDLYGKLARLTDKIRQRRMRMAGHSLRHPELVASELVLW